MIQIVVRVVDCVHSAHVDGAPAIVTYETFNIEAPELEKRMVAGVAYGALSIVGGNVIPPSPGASDREAGR